MAKSIMIKVPITNMFTVAHDLWWKNFTCETGFRWYTFLRGYLGGQTGVWQVWYVAVFMKALGTLGALATVGFYFILKGCRFTANVCCI